MDAKGWQRDQAWERYCCIWDRIPARLSMQVSYPTRIDGTFTTSLEDREEFEKTAETIRRKVRGKSGDPVRSPSRFCGGLAARGGLGRLRLAQSSTAFWGQQRRSPCLLGRVQRPRFLSGYEALFIRWAVQSGVFDTADWMYSSHVGV